MKDLEDFLDVWMTDEIMGLATLLEVRTVSPAVIANAFAKQSHSGLTYVLGQMQSYHSVVVGVAKKLGVKAVAGAPVAQLEIEIAQAVLKATIKQMSPAQRQAFEQQLREITKTQDPTATLAQGGSMLALLGAAQLSGFGVYLLACNLVGCADRRRWCHAPFCCLHDDVASDCADSRPRRLDWRGSVCDSQIDCAQ